METVSYEGESGLVAVVRALDNVRALLAADAVTAEQAAAILGCINLHLADVVGMEADQLAQLEQCAGLHCPLCHGYIGYISDLSGLCPHCGERFFWRAGEAHEAGKQSLVAGERRSATDRHRAFQTKE
jgi:hypothetical protein